MKDYEDQAPLETHQPCPDCDSSDGMAIYEDHTFCYVCKARHWTKSDPNYKKEKNIMSHDLTVGTTQAIGDRKISLDTAKFYGVSVKDGKHYYPYTNQEGVWAANKVRVVSSKEFYNEGDPKKLQLFGQKKFSQGGRYITITEGELDALAAYQMMGSKYPVVSIRASSGAEKECKLNYQWLDSFDNIIVCFDQDEPGNAAADVVAALFPAKVKVVKLDKILNDPCNYLLSEKWKEFSDHWWRAEVRLPDGLVNGADLKDRIKNKKNVECIPGPWEGLDDKTYGFRLSEMWTLTAGSGMGKTQILRELEHHFLKTTDYNIGCFFIEETPEDSGEGLMSIEADLPLHLPDTVISPQEWDRVYDETLGKGRVTYFDGFGESSKDRICSHIRYMAKGLDCKIIFLDHISIMVSGQDGGDERKALDEIATELKKLCMELGILLILVSHSKRPAGKPHEEGGQTSLSELRGTAGIGQLSNMVLGLERNGQSDDPIDANTTLIRVLKNRFSGLTGPTSHVYYNRDTGRLSELTEDTVETEEKTDEVTDH